MAERDGDRIERARANRQPDLHVIVEDPRKDSNVSAVVRSAEAVGVAKLHIIKSDGLGQSFSPKVTRGAERWLEVETHSEPGTCLARLAEAGMTVYCSALAEGAVDFRAADYTRPCAIAVGSEGEGASGSLAALSDRIVMIPMLGLTESLNMGAAAAVLLYEAQRQRQLAGMYATSGLEADAPAYLEGG